MSADGTANILIVDDERPLLESYAAMLETRYEVATAVTGEGAIEMVTESTDVVLLDRRLPEYAGEEVLRAIRERGFDCRVLFCSAVVPDVDILSVEPDGYLHKPVGTDELIEAIETQLEEASQPAPVQEYLRLKRLKSTLSETQPQSHLAESDQYQELLDRLKRTQQSIDNSQHGPPVA